MGEQLRGKRFPGMGSASGMIIFLLFPLLFLSTNLYADAGMESAKPVYPGKTLFITPFAGTGLSVPLGGQSTGGSLFGGVSVSPLLFPDLHLSLEGGYSFTGAESSGTVQVPYAGIGASWRIPLGRRLSLFPQGGMDLIIPITSSGAGLGIEAVAGIRVEAHIHSRNRLFLVAETAFSAGTAVPPRLSLAIGMAKSHPVMLTVPNMGASFIMDRKPFSPDGDGVNDRLSIRIDMKNPASVKEWHLSIHDVNGKLFYHQSGTGAPWEVIEWDGTSLAGELVSSARLYYLNLQLTDIVGRREHFSGTIMVDILVAREHGKLKIQIPDITFPPESADFSLLTDPVVIATNRRVLSRLADFFSVFPDYAITIEGHANMEYFADPARARQEQEEVLIPLSAQRAEAVREALIELGIEGERIKTAGIGAAEPIVPFTDAENRWKNRRVEFILLRPEETTQKPR